MARIVIAQSSRSRWSIALHEGVTRIGTAPDQDLRIDDPSVAKTHCELVVAEGRVFVRDLGSGLDTLNDGSRVVGTTRVRDGQVLRIGKVEVRIESEFSDLEPLTSLAPVLQTSPRIEDRPLPPPPMKPQASLSPQDTEERGQLQTIDIATKAAIEHQVGPLRRLCMVLIFGLTAMTLAAITWIAHSLLGSK